MADTNPRAASEPKQGQEGARPTPGEAARTIMRQALKATLATLETSTGHPYASLVTIATDVDGTPLFLISKLALHTRNIAADGRASLLFDGTSATGDPLAGGRVTVMGRAAPTQRATARARFLDRHPPARGYADFADFAFFELAVERAHFIGGFGRIVGLAATDILIDTADASALLAGHADIVEHMNDDHTAAVELYATELAGAAGGPWRLAGLDPEGFDLVCDGKACRIAFANRVSNPDAARQEFIRFAALARERKSNR
jgi:putative heme iron utilization protein